MSAPERDVMWRPAGDPPVEKVRRRRDDEEREARNWLALRDEQRRQQQTRHRHGIRQRHQALAAHAEKLTGGIGERPAVPAQVPCVRGTLRVS
jgi:hypothetical protein